MSVLQDKISSASQKYYQNGTSDISDSEFDNLLEKEKAEDPNSPLLRIGHGYQIRSDTTSGDKVKHKYGIAGSLVKCHNYEELPNIMKGDELWASQKLDGLSVVLYYKEGILQQALTRGDGEIGVDITDKIRVVLDITLPMAPTFTGAVRGEILMSLDNFDVYSQDHLDAKNPRNTAVGIVKSKEISEDLSYIDVVVYTVVGDEATNSQFTSYTEVRKWLRSNFRKVAPAKALKESDLDEVNFQPTMQTTYNEFSGSRYPCDGIVLTKETLEHNEQEVAYVASAFKFKSESAVTKVIGIEWKLSKTKYLVPRINIETVQLSGTSVSWCTGFNAKFILDNKIGIGAEVEVYKSGEIIPYLDKVITPANSMLPVCCPCCNETLVWKGVHLACPNRSCSDGDVQDVLVWMENIAPWDGLGDTLKLTFLQELYGEEISLSAIYRTPIIKFTEYTNLVKKKAFNRMMLSLFTNAVKLEDALKALNIPRIGDVTARNLAQHPDVVKDILENCKCLDKLDYSSVIGDANWKSIQANGEKIARLIYIKHHICWQSATCITGDRGKVAITGKLSVKRAAFEQELRDHGYNPGSISKDTKFLITDDPSSSSEKNKKADAWGIVKLTEKEFRQSHLN